MDVPSSQAVLRYGTEILGDPALLHIAPVPPTDPPGDFVRFKQDEPAEAYLRLDSYRSGGGRGSGPLHAYMCLLLQHTL